MIAEWNGQVVAESFKTRKINDREYFPMDHVKERTLVPKGEAMEATSLPEGKPFYYDVVTENGTLEKGAWTFPNAPADPMINYSDYITFSDEVTLKEA